MGFLDALLGRSKPASANLDRIFALTGAAITLEASEGWKSTAQAGVCFKAPTGQDFKATEDELKQLLSLGEVNAATDSSNASSTRITESDDEFGYHWIVLEAANFDDLVTRTHLVNSTLQDHGYGPQLLCSVFGFAAAPATHASAYLVYLYKRGSFYPFIPSGDERRDNEAELRLKAELASDLAIEPELDRWFPIWKLPLH